MCSALATSVEVVYLQVQEVKVTVDKESVAERKSSDHVDSEAESSSVI